MKEFAWISCDKDVFALATVVSDDDSSIVQYKNVSSNEIMFLNKEDTLQYDISHDSLAGDLTAINSWYSQHYTTALL